MPASFHCFGIRRCSTRSLIGKKKNRIREQAKQEKHEKNLYNKETRELADSQIKIKGDEKSITAWTEEDWFLQSKYFLLSIEDIEFVIIIMHV